MEGEVSSRAAASHRSGKSSQRESETQTWEARKEGNESERRAVKAVKLEGGQGREGLR